MDQPVEVRPGIFRAHTDVENHLIEILFNGSLDGEDVFQTMCGCDVDSIWRTVYRWEWVVIWSDGEG